MTVANKLRVERGAPHTSSAAARRRRMRRAQDPSGFGGRGQRSRRDPQHRTGDTRSLRSQRQLAARDQIELARLAPDFQHHRAERVAGQRIGCAPQRRVDVSCAHADHKARIETEFGEPAHRQRTRFNLVKNPGAPRPADGAGSTVPQSPRPILWPSRSAVPRQNTSCIAPVARPPLQRRIGARMAERDAIRAHTSRLASRCRSMRPRKAASMLRACAHMRRFLWR